jgi:antagonist of KipI
MILVLSPGLLATVQDLGRPGYAASGVSASGAADALALRAGNLLVGNHPRSAGIEMTMTGGAFEFAVDAVVAITGATPIWRQRQVRAGEVIRCGPFEKGARQYLCVRGGIDAPLTMGSASAHLVTGVGGRPLRKGDTLRIGVPDGRPAKQESVDAPERSTVIRVTPGPQSHWFGEEFYAARYRVSPQSDRMGLRLEGPPVRTRGDAQLLTEGVSLGAVQITTGGHPIILFVEHQTTGGYPKIANVISADFHTLGQLRPRDEITFTQVTLDEALEMLRRQESWLGELA